MYQFLLLLILTYHACVQNNDGKSVISGEQLIALYNDFVSEFPIVSIEDPFDQDDWSHYTRFTDQVGKNVQVVGDDLLVTNPKVSDERKCNAMPCPVPSYPCTNLFVVASVSENFRGYRKPLTTRPAMHCFSR